MQTIEDFTTLPAGTVVWPEGCVQTCPKCGRSGVEQTLTVNGTVLFFHAQRMDVQCDGMLIERQEYCAIPPS